MADDELGMNVEVVEASGGFEALRLLPRGPYDMVISDINMPDINGFELLRFMRSGDRYKDIPLILISTRPVERERQRGLDLGANDYVAKPFTPEELRKAILRHLPPGEVSADNRGL